MEPSTTKNYRGRFEYLDAAGEHWPQLLTSLRDHALEPFDALMRRNPKLRPTSDSELRRAADQPEMTEVSRALEAWATSHDIRDGWILDAAVQTLVEWWRGNKKKGWFYTPQELNTLTFNPTFGTAWLPPGHWDEFRKAAGDHFRKELKKYRDTVARLRGADRKTLSQQAIWTVLWQRGKSVGQIRLWEGRKHGRKPSEANIQRRVNKFAASIGLTLRPAIHGPQKKT